MKQLFVYFTLFFLGLGFLIYVGVADAAPDRTGQQNYLSERPWTQEEIWWKRYEVNLGVEAGPAFFEADQTANKFPQASLRPGASFSVFAQGHLWNYVYVQQHLGYVEKGLDLPDGTFLTHYIEIPTLVKLKPRQLYYGFSPYLITGPNLAFHVGSSDSNPGIEPIDFSWDVGLGVERKVLKNFTAFFTMKGSFGLINVSQDTAATQGAFVNQGFLMQLGMMYAL